MNRKLSLALAASVLVSATAGCASSLTPNTAGVRANNAMLVAGKPIPGRFIVKMRPGQALRMRQGSGVKAEKAIDSLNVYGVEAPAGRSVSDLKKEFGPGVEYIEADVTITLSDNVETLTSGFSSKAEAPKENFNDPMASEQWAIGKTQQAEALAATRGGSGEVVVAIVDTGVDLTHPDLKGKLVKGYNATGVGGLFGLGSPADDNGHGTHCAGIAAAITNNGVGIVGMAANCKVMPVRVLAGAGSGSLLSVAKGITWAADHGADVISLSLGGAGTMQSLGDAVEHAIKKNSVVVAAMGNSGHQGNPVSYPAAYPGVIAVGATDSADKIGMFSSFNKYCSVSAPGVKIWATTPMYDVWLTKNSGGRITKEYSFMTGTSMATPLVAGLCGLIRSVHPDMAPAQVKALLEKTADKTADMNGAEWNEKFGFGRINAYKAVTAGR
ncbi:MAG: S8 family serine peptidase [Candidatus Sericytochromatia bacterium]|nr:S8 family serine peptidase [Candidatus Sericytochromatia bacterium]